MSEQNPISYQMRGILSGFSALYALFVLGCLVMFVLGLLIVPDGWLKNGVVILSGLGFLSLAIYACILQRKDPEAYLTKQVIEIQHTYQVKEPQEKQSREVVSKPTPLLTEKLSKIKRLKQ